MEKTKQMRPTPYSNMKRYDSEGRRCAIFGIPIATIGEFEPDPLSVLPDQLYIKVFPCSKKDQFSKKVAKQAFFDSYSEESKYHPITIIIPIKDPKRPKWSFLMWCKENYYKLVEDKFPINGSLLGVDFVRNKDKTFNALKIKTLYK